MQKDFWVYLDEIEEAVSNGLHMPLTDRVMVSESEIFDLLDALRASLPEELTEARWVAGEKERILGETRLESERILERAKEQAQRLTSESAVTSAAKRQAEGIIAEARTSADKIISGVQRYADDVLSKVGEILQSAVAQVEQGRRDLHASAGREEAAFTLANEEDGV